MSRRAIRTISKAALIALALLVGVPVQAGTNQIIVYSFTVSSGAASRYFWSGGSSDSTLTEANASGGWAVAGTLRNLRVHTRGAALPSGGTNTVTVRINGADTALSAQVNNSTQTATDTDSVAIAAGDRLTLRSTSNISAGAHVLQVALEFEGTAANTTVGLFGGGGGVLSTAPTNDAALCGGSDWSSTTYPDVVSVAGTVTAQHVRLSATPGGTNTRTFTLVKNGTVQDGSGGTVDTRVAFGSGDQQLSASFSLAVAVGDTLAVRHTTTGTPSTSHAASGSVAFTASSTDQWNFCASYQNAAPSTSAVNYGIPFAAQPGSGRFDTTETNKELKNGPTSFYLTRLRADLINAPTSGKSYAFMLRKNAGDTTQTVSVADANTSATATANAVLIGDGDTFTMRVTPSGTPANAAGTKWTLIAAETDPGTGSGGGGGGGFNALLIVGAAFALRLTRGGSRWRT